MGWDADVRDFDNLDMAAGVLRRDHRRQQG
jgi:hypothetical protein